MEQIVDISVSELVVKTIYLEYLEAYRRTDRRTVEQITDFPVPQVDECCTGPSCIVDVCDERPSFVIAATCSLLSCNDVSDCRSPFSIMSFAFFQITVWLKANQSFCMYEMSFVCFVTEKELTISFQDNTLKSSGCALVLHKGSPVNSWRNGFRVGWGQGSCVFPIKFA